LQDEPTVVTQKHAAQRKGYTLANDGATELQPELRFLVGAAYSGGTWPSNALLETTIRADAP
jgi:hypothetical protein